MNILKKHSTAGFTLIELLTVIAIIGILAAIIIPTVGSVKISANKSKTKVQFNQWAVAMDAFKQEYGYYPQIDGGTGNKVDPDRFAGALSGRNITTGAKITTTTSADLCGNKRVMSFYSIADSELNEAKTDLVDAFGNTDIAVYYDKNGDGMITTADGAGPVTVTGIDSTTARTPTFTLSATNGPRASVIFYSAGRGDANTDIVYSWETK